MAQSRLKQSSSPEVFGINLIGSVNSGIGLSVTTRAIAALLKSRGVPFSIFDVPFSWISQSQTDPYLEQYQVTNPEQLVYPVNLYVLPISYLQTFIGENPALFTSRRLHIANIWWEASQLPAFCVNTINRFDGVLAMSSFIAEICRNSLTMTPVLYAEHPLDLPQNIYHKRKEFGLADNEMVFVASFDPHSDPTRKNPIALITAFCSAFPASDADVRLLIRVNKADSKMGKKVVQFLRKHIQHDDRIRLVLEPMSYKQVLCLYACADVYLSFHRGEGLGLGMLESMRLGKPVIATGWSGNLSFMNHSNSALLRYRLIPVKGSYKFFQAEVLGKNARWADPVLEDAVVWMHRLRQNPELRKTLGEAAKASALEYQQRAAAAAWLTELEALWKLRRHLPLVTEKLSSKDLVDKSRNTTESDIS